MNSTTFDIGSSIFAAPSYVRLQSLPSSVEDFHNIIVSIYPLIDSVVASSKTSLQILPHHLSWSNALNLVLLFLLLINIKCWPFVYHLRILNGMRHMLRCMRPANPLTPEHLFQPLITTQSAPLMEIDVYGHKNNNTYFTDHDIARVHLLSTMFGRGIEKIRGSVTMNGLSGKTKSSFTIPLGAVSCSFYKELKPYEQYDLWTRILSWDQKWLYIVTHFVKKGAKIEPEEMSLYTQQRLTSKSRKPSRQRSVADVDTRRESVDSGSGKPKGMPIAASALSKIVFKDGRITIAPEVMLEASGLLPPKPTGTHLNELANAQVRANEDDVGSTEAVHELQKVAAIDSDDDTSQKSASEEIRNTVLREKIEAERVRGLRLAQMLAGQSELEHELKTDVALGKHVDGYGIEGVISTLLQLGKLSNYQLY